MRLFRIITGGAFISLFATRLAAAGECESGVLCNPLDPSISSIPAFFNAILEIVIIFAVPFVVFFIILAGFHYVTARGNPEKLKQAHQALLYALIGGVLILGAQVLLVVIQSTVDQVISGT